MEETRLFETSNQLHQVPRIMNHCLETQHAGDPCWSEQWILCTNV